MSPKEPLGWSGAHTRSPDQTRRAGSEFAGHLNPGDVVALHGELGSGKTTFVQGMAEGLGLHEQVSSPTFTLIHEFGRPPRLYHLDCYRETSLERWPQLGVGEYFDGPAVTVIEWAENMTPLLPEHVIHLTFSYGPEESERIIEVAR